VKVYINRKVRSGPYGGGNLFVKAFHEIAPKIAGVEVLIDPTMNINPDIILCAGLENESPQEIGVEQALMYKTYVKPDVKLVLRVNENDVRKGTSHMDTALVTISEHIDSTVFVSKWLQEYFADKGWKCPNQTVIHNGVDKEIFKAQPKLDNGKLNIVAHHWSDNYLKGADIYEKLDELVGEHPDKFAFTYIGRHQCNFKNTKVIRPLHGKALGEELGKHDVYVSASRFDPGPNHVLEALACGMPTYVHEDGGGAVEFAGVPCTYKNWYQLEQILNATHSLGPSVQRHLFPDNSVKLLTWQECIEEYNRFLEATWQGKTSGSHSS